MNAFNPESIVKGSIKAATKAAGASAGKDIVMVPVDQIRVIPGFNVRIENARYQEHLEWLKNSIINNGFLIDKPLTGYVMKDGDNDVFAVVDGHSRLRAAKMAIEAGAPITALPMVMRTDGTSPEELNLSILTQGGLELLPLEKIEPIKRLLAAGWTKEKVAERSGIGKTWLDGLLSLGEAPAAIRKLVEEGKVSTTSAIEQIKTNGKDALKILKIAVKKGEDEAAKKLAKTKPTTPAQAKKAAAAVGVEPPKPTKSFPVAGAKLIRDTAAEVNKEGGKPANPLKRALSVFFRQDEERSFASIADYQDLDTAHGKWWVFTDETPGAEKVRIVQGIRFDIKITRTALRTPKAEPVVPGDAPELPPETAATPAHPETVADGFTAPIDTDGM